MDRRGWGGGWGGELDEVGRRVEKREDVCEVSVCGVGSEWGRRARAG